MDRDRSSRDAGEQPWLSVELNTYNETEQESNLSNPEVAIISDYSYRGDLPIGNLPPLRHTDQRGSSLGYPDTSTGRSPSPGSVIAGSEASGTSARVKLPEFDPSGYNNSDDHYGNERVPSKPVRKRKSKSSQPAVNENWRLSHRTEQETTFNDSPAVATIEHQQKSSKVVPSVTFQLKASPSRSASKYEVRAAPDRPTVSAPDRPTVCPCPDPERACEDKLPGNKHLRRFILYGIPVSLLLLLFLILMPISVEYVELYSVALKRSKTTGAVDKTTTYFPGCYVLGPDSQFVYFQSSVHLLSTQLTVFSTSRLEVALGVSLLYHIRPQDLGSIYNRYGSDYNDVVESIAISAMKNSAVIFTVEDFMYQRNMVENVLHTAVQDKLDREFMEVPQLWLGQVTIPDIITDRILSSLLQQIENEKLEIEQESHVAEIHTQKYVQDIDNQANELHEGAVAARDAITSVANVQAAMMDESATFTGWADMCDRLQLSRQDHKLSLLFFSSLARMSDLYAAPSEASFNYTYTYFSGFDFLSGT